MIEKRGFLFSFLIDFANMLVRNTYPVQFPLIEPSAAISKASSPWAHRHVFSYNRCFLWLWSHNGALKQRFHEVGLLIINNVPSLYVQCTVWSINVGVAGNPPGWVFRWTLGHSIIDRPPLNWSFFRWFWDHLSTGFPNCSPIRMHSIARQHSIVNGWKFVKPVLQDSQKISKTV